jgi:hypothetical protein
MLGSIKPKFYLEQASQLFQLVYHAKSSLSTIGLSFAADEDSAVPLQGGIRKLAPSEARRRHASIVARLKSRCVGLLEVQNNIE